MTSGGRRRLISCLGFCDLGRPPLLTTARLSMSSVSSGSSLYSWGLTTCEATLVRSEPKVRGEAGLLTVICLSHAEDVSDSATGRVAHNDQASTQEAEAEHTAFTIVFSVVIDLNSDASEDFWCILEIQSALFKRLGSLGRIEGDVHVVSVDTKTLGCKGLDQPQAPGV